MPEDAGVNGLAPHVRVREMQTKLHRWAVADAGRRFDDLYNLVCDPAFLLIAWERVAGNSGARTAGVDRYTVRDVIDKVGVTVFLEDLRHQLQRTEVTNRMLIFCERHLRSVLAQYSRHYNRQRPHRALQLRPPRPESPVPEPVHGRIRRRPVLGGLLNEYGPAA